MPLELETEGVVLDAELVEVVDGGDVFLRGVAKVVGGAVGEAALDAGTGEPHGHGFVVMIAADGALVAMCHRCAAKYDILLVSSALVLGCDTFWSFDTKPKKLAKLEGLKVN